MKSYQLELSPRSTRSEGFLIPQKARLCSQRKGSRGENVKRPYQIEGTGKNRTQRVVIHYRFVGCLQIPEWHRKRKITLESRQGVAVNYLPTTA